MTSRGIAVPTHYPVAAFSLLADAATIAGSLWVISWLYGMPWHATYNVVVVGVISLFLLFAFFYGLYHNGAGVAARREFGHLLLAWLTTILGLLLLAYGLKVSEEYSRRLFLTWFTLVPLLLFLWRGWSRIILGAIRGSHTQKVAIVGAEDLGVNLARRLLGAPWIGLEPVGFYDDRAPTGTRPLAQEPVQVIGNLNTLVNHARAGQVTQIFITLPMSAQKRIKNLIVKLSNTTASVYLVPDILMLGLLNAKWASVGDLPVVSIVDTPLYGLHSWVKRLEDIILATLILLLIALPMIAIAIGVKLSTPGPIIFKQRRYGLGGEEIEVWKFRTMTVVEDGSTHLTQATRNDPRVTRFGTLLRRTSLDELPQFINVLRGGMSIVGPRPHALIHNEQYRKLIHGYMLRHKVKPGITGLAQVAGWRGETEVLDKMEKRVQYDLTYIQNWSLWLDLKIILKTLLVGFSSKKAY